MEKIILCQLFVLCMWGMLFAQGDVAESETDNSSAQYTKKVYVTQKLAHAARIGR